MSQTSPFSGQGLNCSENSPRSQSAVDPLSTRLQHPSAGAGRTKSQQTGTQVNLGSRTWSWHFELQWVPSLPRPPSTGSFRDKTVIQLRSRTHSLLHPHSLRTSEYFSAGGWQASCSSFLIPPGSRQSSGGAPSVGGRTRRLLTAFQLPVPEPGSAEISSQARSQPHLHLTFTTPNTSHQESPEGCPLTYWPASGGCAQ